MTIKSKKKKVGKSKIPSLPENPRTESYCKDEVIFSLYNVCRGKSKGIKDVKIYLENVYFHTCVDYETKYLDELKTKNIIKDYKIEEKENFHSEVIEMPIEPDLWLLPVSEEVYRNAPKKDLILDNPQCDYVAIVKCYPQRIVKRFKNDFKRIAQKRKEITKRIEIENSFKGEQIFECEELKFGLRSGNAIYGDVVINFKPEKKPYKMLKLLMQKPNEKHTFQEISGILFGTERWGNGADKVTIAREISSVVKHIKEKLKIIGKEPKNKNLFFCHNGYEISCELKQ